MSVDTKYTIQKGGSWGVKACTLSKSAYFALSASNHPVCWSASIPEAWIYHKLSYKQSRFWKRQKLVQNHGQTNKNKQFHPMSPVQLPLRPSPWVETFCVFLFSRGFCHLDPKMHQNLWKKQKTTKKQTVSPHVTCPASPQTLSIGRNFFFVFSRFLQLCQSKQYQLLIFSCFLFSCFLGSRDKFSPWQTSIGTAFTPPHFILMSSLSYWFWLLSHQRKCTVKTARLYHPPLQALHWSDVLLVCRGFGSSCLKVWLVFFKPGITKNDI